jgi:hypothetical protein
MYIAKSALNYRLSKRALSARVYNSMSRKDREPKRNSEWMIAYVTHDITDAHVVLGRLKSEGIMAIIDHMAGMHALGVTLGNMGEIRVLVYPQDYDQVMDLLYPEAADELPDSTDHIIYDWDEDNDDE